MTNTVPLRFDASNIFAGQRSSVAALIVANPEYWFDAKAFEIGEFHQGNICVLSGGGPYESEGWIAFHRHNSLVWIINLAGSEPITDVRVADDEISASGDCYPIHNRFFIPLKQPEAMRWKRDVCK